MAKTPQWIKTLGGHAGALFVAGELAKRGIPALLLPEGFSDDDVLGGGKDGSGYFYVQVKSCHPDRSQSFRLKAGHEEWVSAPSNSFVAFVWLGSPGKNHPPRYWIARKSDVGRKCVQLGDRLRRDGRGHNPERRLIVDEDRRRPGDLTFVVPHEWENKWSLFDAFQPAPKQTEKIKKK